MATFGTSLTLFTLVPHWLQPCWHHLVWEVDIIGHISFEQNGTICNFVFVIDLFGHIREFIFAQKKKIIIIMTISLNFESKYRYLKMFQMKLSHYKTSIQSNMRVSFCRMIRYSRSKFLISRPVKIQIRSTCNFTNIGILVSSIYLKN